MNGTIIYSTCSLSPIQNEGVVNTVVRAVDEDYTLKYKLRIEPLDHIKASFGYFFDFSATCKHGMLVLPTINKNFGPFFLCKLTKIPRY